MVRYYGAQYWGDDGYPIGRHFIIRYNGKLNIGDFCVNPDNGRRMVIIDTTPDKWRMNNVCRKGYWKTPKCKQWTGEDVNEKKDKS